MNWDEEPAKVEMPVQRNSNLAFSFGAGIKPATEIPSKKNTVIGIFGTFGTGKSYWAASAKRPVVIVDTEKRSDNIILQMKDTEGIHLFDVMQYAEVAGGDLNYAGMLDQFRADLVKFANDCKQKTQEGTVGTIVIDSMSDIVRWYAAWLEQQVHVKRDPDGSVSGFERIKSREKLREFIDLLKMTGWNVIVTFKEKQAWEGGKPSDNFNPEWDKELGYACDILINLRMVGTDRKFILQKNSYGPTTLDIRNVDWRGFLDKITESSGIKFD